MKFYTTDRQWINDDALKEEFDAAKPIGSLRIGNRHLFFRAALKHYAIPFNEILGCFRRIRAVDTKLCCGRGTMEMEYLVVRTATGEAAEIGLPGKRAAQKVMEILKAKIPDADFTVPAKT